MCEQKRGVPVGTVVVVLAAAVAVSLAVSWLTGAWPLVLAAVAVLGALAGAVVLGLRAMARRVTVPRWSAAYQPRRVRSHYGERITTRALPAPRKAIEAAPLRVMEGAIIKPGERISR